MTKLLIIKDGSEVVQAPPSVPRGARIIEIIGDDGVPVDRVIAAYKRVIISPIMYDGPIPWDRIKDAPEGRIVRMGSL